MNASLLSQIIRTKLSELPLRRLEMEYTREAAVLMPIIELDGEPCFLLTVRTKDVKTHKGQISFPGGMRHDGEPLLTTALRETYEEVGIAADRIEVLGRFHEYASITGYCVTPFAGYIPTPFSAVPHAGEVAEILNVPMRIFLDPVRVRIEQRYRLGQKMDVHFYSYEAHQIWGLTARIIRDFMEQIRPLL
jgi:8-oxo-dGTP pyrophosphatase MutT (NUDIX family)